MRLLLLLTALAVVTWASQADEEVISRVLKSWDLSKPIRVIDNHKNDNHSIPLYEDDSMVLAIAPCNPGYTGETCTTPICVRENRNVPQPVASGEDTAPIESAVLSNCAQNYAILVDESMTNIRIKVEAELAVIPMFELLDSSGNTVPFDEIWEQSPRYFETINYALTPGVYTVAPKADSPITCSLTVTAHTEMTVVGGFTIGDRSVAERNDFPVNYVNINTQNTAVIHINKVASPASLKTIRFVGSQNTFYRPDLVQIRYGCGYEYFVWGFECSVIGEHFLQVEGVTHYGNRFHRILPFDCLPDVNATAPPTTPQTTPKSCQNGGMRVNNLDGTSYCFCQGLWTGNDCSQIMCMNGGTVNPDNTCGCPDGFNGNHCETIYCPDIGGFGFNANSPTMIFVVRGRQQMNSVITQMENAMIAFLSNLQFDPTYINNFILVLFNNNQMILSRRYIDFNNLLVDLNKAKQNFTTDGGCTDSLFSAISQALNMFPTNKSPMYVFTDATPNDISYSETIIHQLSFWRVPINIIYTTTSTTCTVMPNDPNYAAMTQLSQKSMGATFFLDPAQTFNFTYDHMFKTVYRSQLMLSNDISSCSNQNPYQTVTIENLVQDLVVVATGSNLVLTLTAPETEILNPLIPTTIYSDGQNFIWSFNRVTTGTWLIGINSTVAGSPCSFKVIQKSLHGASAQTTQYDLFWALTSQIDRDGPTQQPVVGWPLSIAVHLTNYPLIIPPQYIQSGINVYANRNGKQVEVYASNGDWRGGCDYNFYFQPFSCPIADETLYFNFYARDELGMAIQRAGVMNCMQFVPTPTPPGDCLNGGVINAANNTCYCPMGFSGPHCEKITCFNGGTPILNGTQCQCSPSWTGPYCNIAKCLERGPDPEVLTREVDMIFAVELTANGQGQLVYLDKNFAELLRDIQSQNKRWIANVVLVAYNSTWGDVVHVSPIWEPSGVINALNNLANRSYTDKGCVVQLYRALNRAVLRGTTPPGSFIEIFQATPSDDSPEGGWSQMYENMRNLYLNVYGYLAVTNPSGKYPTGLFCNATFANFTLLFDLCGGSAGRVYITQSAEIQYVMKTIPLQYSSGMVYGQYGLDCTAPMQVYFPIDAYTQTILLITVGNNTQVQVFDSQNRPVTADHFMQDLVSLVDLFEIRKPCDSNWTAVGQYCIQMNSQRMTWNDAQSYCSRNGGFLVDDLTKDKHSFLTNIANSNSFSGWLGLRNPTGNGYVWDRGNNPPTNLNQSDMFWAGGGGIPAYDPARQCVFWNNSALNDKTWTQDSCSTLRTFICQKHGYDESSPPTNPDSLHLPAGMWYANISTSAPPSISGYHSCYAEIRVQSQLQIYTGFVTNSVMDFPANDPVDNTNQNMLITYTSGEDNESQNNILKYALMWDAYNGTFYNAAQYQYRVGCSFSWLSQPFACPNANDPMNEFAITHIGEDSFGNMFQRVTLAHCREPILTCGNGGYRYNGQCICNEYWTGSFCTTPICVNGGTLDPKNDQSCVCPRGYGGPNCQFDECMPRIPYNFSPENRTLILMVESTKLNMDAWDQLSSNFSSVVYNALSKDPTWFKNYAFIVFDSNEIKYTHFTYTSPDALQIAIQMEKLGINDPGNCTTNIYSALAQTLMQKDQIQFPNSQILLITASGAKDYMTRTMTIEQLSDSEANLHWLYMGTDTCGSIPSDPSMPHLVKLAYASNGNAVFITGKQLTSFLTPYLASRYQAQTLDNPTVGVTNGTNSLTCSKGSWLIQVDANTTAIYVTSNSLIGQPGVTDPNGNLLMPVQLFSAGQTQFIRVDITSNPGMYTVTLSSFGACFVSIYGTGSSSVFTHFTTIRPDDPRGAHADGISTTPHANVTTNAVFHLQGTPGHRGQLNYLEVVDVSTGMNILRSELYRRTSCSFEYYSDPFSCPADIVTLYIYGIDENYQSFRRQQMSFCVDGVLPTYPPIQSSTMASTSTKSTAKPMTTTPGTTQTTASPTTSFNNFNLLFDVVFLIDVSNSANATYNDMSNFVSNLMSNYAVSQSGARVGLIPVDGAGSPQTFPAAYFNSITSMDMLNKYLKQIGSYYQDFDDLGENLQQALTEATSPGYLSNGYRTSLSNHLLVYVTSTSTFSDNPSTTSILSFNTYGIIVVGYGPGVTNGAALQALAGGAGCYFSAPTAGDLTAKVSPSVQSLIWNANFNNGTYCGNVPN